MKPFIQFRAIILLLIWLSLALGACGETAQPETLVNQYAPRLDYLAPDFQLNQYSTNQPLKLSDFKGKPVMINFWQSFCVPCQAEMPEIATAYHQYQKDGLIILGVNVREGNYTVARYLQGKNFDWTMLMDPGGTLVDRYEVQGFPSSIFVDRQGFIRAVKLGQLDKPTLNEDLTKIMQHAI